MYCFHSLIASLLVSDYDLECFGFRRHNFGHRDAVFCCCIVDTQSVVSLNGLLSLLFAIDFRFYTFPELDSTLGQTRSMEPCPTSLVAAFDNQTVRILRLPAFADRIQ
jgi:hypothetical protein